MVIGVLLYYVFDAAIPDDDVRNAFYYVVSHYFQPALIFSMLMLSFLKVEPRDLKPHRWHGVLLFTQGAFFVLFSLLAIGIGMLSSLPLLGVNDGKILC